jgi:sugar phosphate isomerase/epimerase
MTHPLSGVRPNRRQLIATLAALPAAARLDAQPAAKPHLRAGLVAYSYRKALADKSMNYEDLIRRIADWGLDGLDCTVYWFPDNSKEYLAKLRHTAFKLGVQIYNAGVRVSLAQPTPELRDAEVEKIKTWVDVADRLGAGHIRVFGGAIPKGATEQQAIGWAAEVMRRGAEYAGTRGIVVGVEDDGGLTTASGPTVAIVKQADTPWAGINADSGNLRDHGYDQFETMLPYTTSVHLKRDITGPDGKKEPADWNRLLTMLAKAGYKGYVGLEYEDNNPETDVPRLAADLRTAVRKVSG